MNIYVRELLNHFSQRYWMHKKILDVGCGDANISIDLAKLGGDIFAIDAREEYLKKLNKTNSHIRTMKVDLDNKWPFANKKFDIILLLDILNYVKDPISLLNNCLKISKVIILETSIIDVNDDQKFINYQDNQKNLNITSFNGVGSSFSKQYLDLGLSSKKTRVKQIKSQSLNNNDKEYSWYPSNNGKSKRIFYIIYVDEVKEENVVNSIPLPSTMPAKPDELSSSSKIKQVNKYAIDKSIEEKLNFKNPKRIAICLSGHFRLYQKTYSKFFEFLVRNNNVDIFIHTWGTLGAGTGWHQTDKNAANIPIKNYINEIATVFSPKVFLIEDNKQKIESDVDKNVYNVYSMFYGIYKAVQSKKEYEDKFNFKYDIVIRCRPDLLFKKPIILDNLDLNLINLPNQGNFSGISDQFAVSNSSNMDIYSELYLNLDLYKKNGYLTGRPEEILNDYICKKCKLSIKHNDFSFDILRFNNAIQNNSLLERRLGMK